MSAPNSQPGFQLHPWISGNLGVFEASCGFLSQIPACSSIPLRNCWEHTFPGILAWIGNGTWEYPTPKAALVTSHKLFPKEKKKKREGGILPVLTGVIWTFPHPSPGFGEGSAPVPLPPIPSAPAQRHSQYSSLSQSVSRPRAFMGSSIPFPEPTEVIPDPSHPMTFPKADSLECLVTSQSHGCATPSGWDSLGAP